MQVLHTCFQREGWACAYQSAAAAGYLLYLFLHGDSEDRMLASKALRPTQESTLIENACEYDISFTELRHRRKYSCLHRRSWGKARRDVVVVEYPPYRPNHTGIPCSPMCSLLETYLIRLQLENTRLAFSLDHAADGVLLARKRTGNVDRIFEKDPEAPGAPEGPGAPNVGNRGFLPGLVFRAGKADAGQLAELAFVEELGSDKFYELASRHIRTTAVAGVCAARDNTALVYSRDALRPEQEISHEQWCALVARAFSLPIGQTDRRNRSAEVIHAFQFYRNSFLHQTALFRDFLNDLLADLETANLRARASHWGLRTDVDKQLLKCWWKAEVLGAPDTGSVEELLQLIKLQNTLRPDLTHEAAILRALYEKYVPDNSNPAGSSKRKRAAHGGSRAKRGRR
eukprot:g33051.t1